MFAFLAIKQTSETLKIRSVEVAIDQSVDLAFIDSSKVLDIVRQVVKTPIIGCARKQFNLAVVENKLEAYPFIDKADVVIESTGLIGRVDVALLREDWGVVSWMETKGGNTFLYAAGIDQAGEMGDALQITRVDPSRKSGFPQLHTYKLHCLLRVIIFL